ncbi:MAG: Nascent polypeptide-associated complex protein [Thermoplasmata archaeon]|nr:Nascent polypeptide-associated complex protein [Candidatus Sysuiplasma acidicola]
MMPGLGKIDPRQMKMAMKKMGMQTEEIEDVSEVIIRTKSKEYRFSKPSVVMVKVSGQQIYQVTGEPVIGGATASESVHSGPVIQQEDIDLVVSQTGCTAEQARQALMQTDGRPADAIIRILTGS